MQASRNVIINDLHRAAASMLLGCAVKSKMATTATMGCRLSLYEESLMLLRKLDFSHHDSPAAMFAVYDASAGRSEHAEAAAKGAVDVLEATFSVY